MSTVTQPVSSGNDRVVTKIELFWDDQDSTDEGWAYRVHFGDGHEEDGQCGSADPDETTESLAMTVLGYIPDDVDVESLKWTELQGVKGWAARLASDAT